jgi:hypothetical protein
VLASGGPGAFYRHAALVCRHSPRVADSLQREEEEPSEEFREQRRRKRNPSEEQPTIPKKAVTAATSVPKEITTRNFFDPLRATIMDTDFSGTEANTQEKAVPGKICRPPPIILTSNINLIQLQKQLKTVVKDDFEFHSTRNGIRVIIKGMADFEAVKSHFTNNNLSYYSFYPKSQKPIKAVIRHLPPNTPAQDISDGLVNRGFDVIKSIKQLTTRRSSTEGAATRNVPLFLISDNLAQDGKITRNFPTAKPLPHLDQCGGL